MHRSLFSEYIVYYSVHVISVKGVVAPVQLSCNGQLTPPFVIYSNIQLTFFSNTRNLMISSVLNFVRERDHF